MARYFVLIVFCFSLSNFITADDAAPDKLSKYTVDYPVVDQFCPPIRSTFYETTRTMMIVNGKRFRQKPNGGYGLPVVMKQEGKNMLHVGADLGWHQVGEPVFAVANGVVRMSAGPDFAEEPKGTDKPKTPGSQIPWGNLIVIEHKTKSGDYYTTIYGHLATKRFVERGDVVKAGQPIGTIGRQHFRINGGYKPHLHFGVLEGRMVERGTPLFHLASSAGTRAAAQVVEIEEDWVQVDLPASVPHNLEMRLGPITTRITKRDDKYFIPARLMWGFQRHDFPLVGYSLTTEGFRDPVAFLKEHQAHTFPAVYLPLGKNR